MQISTTTPTPLQNTRFELNSSTTAAASIHFLESTPNLNFKTAASLHFASTPILTGKPEPAEGSMAGSAVAHGKRKIVGTPRRSLSSRKSPKRNQLDWIASPLSGSKSSLLVRNLEAAYSSPTWLNKRESNSNMIMTCVYNAATSPTELNRKHRQLPQAPPSSDDDMDMTVSAGQIYDALTACALPIHPNPPLIDQLQDVSIRLESLTENAESDVNCLSPLSSATSNKDHEPPRQTHAASSSIPAHLISTTTPSQQQLSHTIVHPTDQSSKKKNKKTKTTPLKKLTRTDTVATVSQPPTPVRHSPRLASLKCASPANCHTLGLQLHNDTLMSRSDSIGISPVPFRDVFSVSDSATECSSQPSSILIGGGSTLPGCDFNSADSQETPITPSCIATTIDQELFDPNGSHTL